MDLTLSEKCNSDVYICVGAKAGLFKPRVWPWQAAVVAPWFHAELCPLHARWIVSIPIFFM